MDLYKECAKAKPNYQFVVDSLTSDKKKSPGTLDLQINSIIIRHGAITYRQLDKNVASDRFSPYHIDAENISGHVVLNKLSNDSINLKVKKLSFDEASGIHLNSLSFKISGNRNFLNLDNMKVELPKTRFEIKNLSVYYKFHSGKLSLQTIMFKGNTHNSYITLSDLVFLSHKLKKYNNKIDVDVSFSGTSSHLNIKKLQLGAQDGLLDMLLSGSIEKIDTGYKWEATLKHLKTNYNGIKIISENIGEYKLPHTLMHLGDISVSGKMNSHKNNMNTSWVIKTDAGKADVEFSRHEKSMLGKIKAENVNLQKLIGDKRFGMVTADINIGNNNIGETEANGSISRLDYGMYIYNDIKFGCVHSKNNTLRGSLSLNDPNGTVELSGKVNTGGLSLSDVRAKIRNLNPSAMHLSKRWPETEFSLDVMADIENKNTNNIFGTISVNGFSMKSPNTTYRIENLTISSVKEDDDRQHISLKSDFGKAEITGKLDISSLPESLSTLISSKLPTLSRIGHDKKTNGNDFAINATIHDSRWMRPLLGIPLELESTLTMEGMLNDSQKEINLNCRIPRFSYNDNKYKDMAVLIKTTGDTIATSALLKRVSSKDKTFVWEINADASNNTLSTTININDGENHPLRGTIKARANFFKNEDGTSTSHISVGESDMHIGDSTWHIQPSSVTFNNENIAINNFSINNGDQFISINGKATKDQTDSISINFKGVDVSYILDMVNFHSVNFSGHASGKAYIAGAFGKNPQAFANLAINNFRFENGRMGVLSATTRYDKDLGQIIINASANDTYNRRTLINGYISHTHKHIDLDITANNTRLEFMESLCSSFMRDVKAEASGNVKISGPLNNINMTGQLVANGTLGISSLNTTYTLKNDTIRFIPDEIMFRHNNIYDRNGNTATINGNIHHQHLTNLSYDLNIEARNLLVYDTNANNGETFYGTVYATGNCQINGRSGEVTMDINARPEKGSNITYNVSTQNADDARELIRWRQIKPTSPNGDEDNIHNQDKEKSNTYETGDDRQVTSDIHLNFLVNCTPDATLKAIMDNQSGDYVALNGDGTLRATYYNKGAFDIFGNYIVDHGVYKLTVRNIIKKDFIFQKGGMIKFGGNPFAASLDLKALYVLNSVSLSDLNIGRSFSNNNVRVNCLMNVTGTPQTPKVAFDLDMPTLSSDAKQMVSSVINAEEEMNQQVLYLLAVGRFYTQGNNNATSSNQASQHNQASLAMQSILSGTISQRINTLLGNVVNNNNWNFGANISTGTEGFNDAEYEGILSGRLLNNRLLLNGQFGYRDNPNATTSFIGDFDLKYLLYPNGNLAINVYNKTNDRYFTRNSLNTQGIGLLMKKDFNGLRDLFGKESQEEKIDNRMKKALHVYATTATTMHKYAMLNSCGFPRGKQITVRVKIQHPHNSPKNR